MKSFALALVASLAAAQTETYEESYSGSAAVADVGSTDYTLAFKVVIEETPDKLTVTGSQEVTWEAVLEGAAIAAGDEVEAWTCFENEGCLIMRSVGTDNLSVHFTESNGTTLPSQNCATATAQPSQALASGLATVATWDGTTVTAGNTGNPEFVPQTVTISGNTISMSAKQSDSQVTDLAAIRQAQEEAAQAIADAEALAAEQLAQLEEATGDLGDLDIGDLDIGDLDIDVDNLVDEATAQVDAATQQALDEAAAVQAAIDEAAAEAEALAQAQAKAAQIEEDNKDIKQSTGMWVKRAGGAATCAQGNKTVKSFAGATARIQTDREEAEAAKEADGAYALTTIAAAAVAVAALAF